MTEAAQREIYRLASASLNRGQARFQVHIFPFRMTDANMEHFASHPWAAFWRDLKAGYDAFERTRRPPSLNVCGQRYVVTPADAGERADAPLSRIDAAQVAAAGRDPDICRIGPERPAEQVAALSTEPAVADALVLSGPPTVFRVERHAVQAEPLAQPEVKAPPRKARLPQRHVRRDVRANKRTSLSSKRRAYREQMAEGYRRDRTANGAH
jgi:hypothetical protein